MKQNDKKPEGYTKSLFSATLILLGAFLILEHECLGPLLVLFGFAISLKRRKEKEVPCIASKVKPGWVAGNMRAIQ